MEPFINYIKSLDKRIAKLELGLEIIDIPIPTTTKIKLSYYPNWRNDITIDGYTHITHCFINKIKDFANIQFIPNVKNGISIGGWSDRKEIINLLSENNDYIDGIIEEINKNPNIDYFNLDIEYPPTNGWSIKLVKYVRENLAEDKQLCVACGLWYRFALRWKGCEKYIDWMELMAYDNDLELYMDKTLETLKELNFKSILIGYSNDKNGDTKQDIQYKDSIKHLYSGIFLWNNPVESVSTSPKSEELGVWKTSRVKEINPFNNKGTFRGSGSIEYKNNGEFSLSGRQPRYYLNYNLQDVSVSVDYMRIGTDGKGWSGGTIGIRSNVEGHSSKPELAHTYYLRLKHEGKIDLYREIKHNGNNRDIIKWVKYKWETNKWYNIKFVCKNLENNKIKLEGYVNNKLVIRYIDYNEVMYNARGVVFIRNTEIQEAKYKNLIIN